MPTSPRAYLLTFSCYGSWLPGDARGSVDHEHRVVGTPAAPADPRREIAVRQRMRALTFSLDPASRDVVLTALLAVCERRGWELLAAHVRTEHVHAVVKAGAPPDRVMTDMKAAATRALNDGNLTKPTGPCWARHGSTRYLWEPNHVEAAVHYVVHEQGAPMAVHVANPDPADAPRRVHGTW